MIFHVKLTAIQDGKPEESYLVETDDLVDQALAGRKGFQKSEKERVDALLLRVATADWEKK